MEVDSGMLEWWSQESKLGKMGKRSVATHICCWWDSVVVQVKFWWFFVWQDRLACSTAISFNCCWAYWFWSFSFRLCSPPLRWCRLRSAARLDRIDFYRLFLEDHRLFKIFKYLVTDFLTILWAVQWVYLSFWFWGLFFAVWLAGS